jgi:hypothetical protein
VTILFNEGNKGIFLVITGFLIFHC